MSPKQSPACKYNSITISNAICPEFSLYRRKSLYPRRYTSPQLFSDIAQFMSKQALHSHTDILREEIAYKAPRALYFPPCSLQEGLNEVVRVGYEAP